MLKLILYYLFSHIFSFLCSILEAVLLSCTPTYIALLKKRGAQAGYRIEEQKAHIDRPLAAILTLNTISHTIGAAGVGASVVELYGETWLMPASIILTLTMLYWTEMLPKTLGALYWKNLVPFTTKAISVLMIITFPFVYSFNFFAKLISRGKKHDRITEEDIRIALEAGAKAGVIEEEEQDMVENIFRLGDRRVGMLMIPRVDVAWLDVENDFTEVREKILSTKQHYFPLCEGDIDRVVGIIHLSDLFEKTLSHKKIELKALMTPPLFVQETQYIFELMDLFKKTTNSVALVTDEFGAIQGMITVAHILNAIVKDIDRGGIEGGSQIYKVNARSFILDGSLPIDEFKEIFHLEKLPNEEKARFRTLSGLCMTEIGAVPKKGDKFKIGNLHFEVIKVKKRRVEKVLLKSDELKIGL